MRAEALAEAYGVARLTVQRAVRELREEGWLEVVVGRGTFVSRSVKPR